MRRFDVLHQEWIPDSQRDAGAAKQPAMDHPACDRAVVAGFKPAQQGFRVYRYVE